MDLPDDVRSTLFDAGAEALRFNVPLGDERAEELVDALGRLRPRTIADLGCGRGEFARLMATRLPGVAVVGVDVDQAVVEAARQRRAEVGLDDRLRFEIADAATWSEPVDAAVCFGGSHAFGGPAGMLARLADLVPSGVALVGDGVWEAEPNPWCVETFGDLPAGAQGLTTMAEAAGWTVLDTSLSTLDEWDAFEGGWAAGVRSLGIPVAHAFAAERTSDYHTHYRGVLGFCWLVLTR